MSSSRVRSRWRGKEGDDGAPEELAEELEVLARGPGVSVNTVVLDALRAEIERIKKDHKFMARLQEMTTKDKEILDRPAR